MTMTGTLNVAFPLAFGVGPMEWIIIGMIGLLLFGKRLPEVGKSVAKGIVEFKRGLKGIDDEIEDAANAPPRKTLPPNETQPADKPTNA